MKLSKEQINSLVERCKDNDRSSQHKIYELYYGKMLGVCLRYAKNMDDAKDIVQDGFIKIFKKIHLYKANGSFEGWLKTLFVNTALDIYRKKKRGLNIVDNSLIEDQAIEIEDNNDLLDSYKGLSVGDVVEAMQNLSPAYRTVFNLYVMEGLTHKEIAEELEINIGTSKSNYAKAKLNIRKLLQNKISHE
jgi:RNA polymerase sigma factor (sigma-70 family)